MTTALPLVEFRVTILPLANLHPSFACLEVALGEHLISTPEDVTCIEPFLLTWVWALRQDHSAEFEEARSLPPSVVWKQRVGEPYQRRLATELVDDYEMYFITGPSELLFYWRKRPKGKLRAVRLNKEQVAAQLAKLKCGTARGDHLADESPGVEFPQFR